MPLAPDRFFDPDPAQKTAAIDLYARVQDLPIVSPHGHVDPSLFSAPGRDFGNPVELLIQPDHYVLRMLYSQRISAELFQKVRRHHMSMNPYIKAYDFTGQSIIVTGASNFTQWLATHMAQEYSPNIRVNAIAPGFFLTEQNRFLLADKDTGQPTERGKKIVSHIPMGRLGCPEDLSGTVLWLMSPASAYVTGIVVPVDGGFSAYSGV